MALYKVLWCILFVSMGLTDGRSGLDLSISSAEHGDRSSQYKYDNEYLSPEATHNTSGKQEVPNACEKIIRNSMLCMVCKDSETNAKYERCSYVSEPSDESFDYAKSKVEKAPEYESSQSRLSKSRSSASRNDEVEKSKRHPKSHHKTSSEYISKSERITKNNDKDKCREEERDGMNCMVCVDSDTGGNFEKCSYAYQPNDKVYKFSKSKRFGYPETKNYDEKPSKSSARRIDDDDENIDSGETRQVVEKEKNINNCREVVRDSMTCTICKDPKSGGNSEQCSYSYKPDDKLYAYSQSRSFGSPKSQEN